MVNQMSRIDTSIEGFRYVGINITEQQYNDLCDLNHLIQMNESRKEMPVFNIMLVLKVLGLLPSEMLFENQKNLEENYAESLQRKFGRVL